MEHALTNRTVSTLFPTKNLGLGFMKVTLKRRCVTVNPRWYFIYRLFIPRDSMKSYSMIFISVTLSVLFTQDVAQYKTWWFLMISCISSEMEMFDSVQIFHCWLHKHQVRLGNICILWKQLQREIIFKSNIFFITEIKMHTLIKLSIIDVNMSMNTVRIVNYL